MLCINFPILVWFGYCTLCNVISPVFPAIFFNPTTKQMKYYLNRIGLLAIAAMLTAASCTQNRTNTQEETEIKTMDSTAKSLKETSEKLEDQTKKVEASLEKLDTEFKENN